ncbi:MAG TPA: dTDP-4-dehydrorhamnose 3,5-epimerase [Verrucomicrobiae bacterium]|nr:dTDP-4-dehydrorhamnose 3,5-epimerase [Verrucomicrobiae bacterium]
MIFTETKLQGAFVMELEKFEDERGFFAHGWSPRELAAHGLEAPLAESAISFNKKKGTLRGMHYQASPHGQIKIVRCTMGAIYDVIIDLRKNSPTFKQWIGIELSATNRLMLYIPGEFAHGFQTLEDEAELCYHMSHAYVPESATGVRWNDPAFGIKWPAGERTIITRDREYPNFN